MKIIYDKSVCNKIIDFKDIEKIIEIIIINKNLNNYILNINVQPIRSKNLASYSNYSKNIIVYAGTVELMIENIEKNILVADDFEKILYQNLSILQIILHEVEHANQEKIAYIENSLEAFIIRISHLIDKQENEKLYECCPTERFAEIKSFQELLLLIDYIKNRLNELPKIIETEKSQRLLRGYHFSDNLITNPIVTYFEIDNKRELLNSFDWYSEENENINKYSLDSRLFYGFPISKIEYARLLKNLIENKTANFKDFIRIKK